MAEDRRARLRRERKAERVPVWDDQGGRTACGRPIKPRWRLIHPDPYGGHGSSTAGSVCGCQCRECAARTAADARARAHKAAPGRSARTRWVREFR